MEHKSTGPREATIVRIVGNTLPPRDVPGARQQILERILTDEAELEGASKVYLVNRIFDMGELAAGVDHHEHDKDDRRAKTPDLGPADIGRTFDLQILFPFH